MINKGERHFPPFLVLIKKTVKNNKKSDWRSELDYPGKPSPNGFPDNPPPKTPNGYHPDFGKRNNMFNTLDDVSASAMPGGNGYNPNITSREVVKINKKRFEEGFSNWRQELLDEGMTTKDFSYLSSFGVYTITSVLGPEKENAQAILQGSQELTDYRFGVEFPGSYVNNLSITSELGGELPNSYSKVDAQAAYGYPPGSDPFPGQTISGPNGTTLQIYTDNTPSGEVLNVNMENLEGNTVNEPITIEAYLKSNSWGYIGLTATAGFNIKIINSSNNVVFDYTPSGNIINYFAYNIPDYFDNDNYTISIIPSEPIPLLSVGAQFNYLVDPGLVSNYVYMPLLYDPFTNEKKAAAGTLGKTTAAYDLGMPVSAGLPQSQKTKSQTKMSDKVLAKQGLYRGSDGKIYPISGLNDKPVPYDAADPFNIGLSRIGLGGLQALQNWWNIGRNVNVPNEKTASWSKLMQDDLKQRGQSDAAFARGDAPKGIGRPDQAFNPFRPASKGGPGSGPTAAVRQAFERPTQPGIAAQGQSRSSRGKK